VLDRGRRRSEQVRRHSQLPPAARRLRGSFDSRALSFASLGPLGRHPRARYGHGGGDFNRSRPSGQSHPPGQAPGTLEVVARESRCGSAGPRRGDACAAIPRIRTAVVVCRLCGGLVWTVCVELANPIAKDLKRHAIDLGRFSGRRAFTNRRKCQEPPSKRTY
jgi:hypothetical protein